MASGERRRAHPSLVGLAGPLVTRRPWDGRPPRDWPLHPVPDEGDQLELDLAIGRHPAGGVQLIPMSVGAAIELGIVSWGRGQETVIPDVRYL